jgi:predicted MFS family arabinose efflux permease
MTAPARSPAARHYILFVLAGLSAMNQLDRQVMNILIEPIRHEFSLGDAQIGALVGLAFALIYTALSIPAALYAIRGNRTALLTVSALIWGAMTAACGFAVSYSQLFLARFGVGIGEAGGMPASHAIISDLYGPDNRAMALSTWAAGVNVGVFGAFLFGGIVGRVYGWRIAFVAAGAVTLALTALLRLTVREPTRHMPSPQAHALSRPLGDTLRIMTRDSILRHVTVASTLASISGYASLTWLPSFFVRSHGMTIAGAGTYLALTIGVGGAFGTWFGGVACDWLRLRDLRWSLWLVAVVLVATRPLYFGALLVQPTLSALLLFLIPGICSAIYVGPSLAVLHNHMRAELRPVASAMFLLVLNFVGLGLGPLLAGVISQFAFASYGNDALRYSLVVVQCISFWAAIHYYLAGVRLGSRKDNYVLPRPATDGVPATGKP